MEHLEGSLASLSSLHSSLQARHLATVDALSALQASVEPSLEELRNERDAVRAVNGVLKGKVRTLENELAESRRLMSRVVEDVRTINDFGILEHAQLEIVSPIGERLVRSLDAPLIWDGIPAGHSHTHAPQLDDSEDAYSDDTEREVHHARFDDSIADSYDYSTNLDNTSLPSPRAFSPRAAMAAQQAKQPEYRQARADRSLNLIADLTEELELVRHEARKELRAKERDIVVLERAVEERQAEVQRAMETVEEVLSLRGYVVRLASDEPKQAKVSAALDAHLRTLRLNVRSQTATKQDASSKSRKASRLEAEVEELEAQLELLESRRGNEDADLHIADGEGSVISLNSKSVQVPQFLSGSELIAIDRSSDRVALSRALTDLSAQIVLLKRALREVTTERDNLRSLRREVRLPIATVSTSG